MTMKMECPVCETEMEVEEWHDDECPECGNGYIWNEVYTDDNYWGEIRWDSYEKAGG